MSAPSKSSYLLIQIGEALCSGDEPGEWSEDASSRGSFDIARAVKRVQAELADLKLTGKDVELVAVALHRTLNESCPDIGV